MSDKPLCGDEMPDISSPQPTCILRAGHESRVHRSAPPVYCWAPLFESGDEVACGECEHPWAAHSKEYGCELGWVYDSEGMSITEGCACLLAHIELSVA